VKSYEGVEIKLSVSEQCRLWQVKRSNYYRWKSQGWQRSKRSKPVEEARESRKTTEFLVEMIQSGQVGGNRTKPDSRSKDSRDTLDDFVLKGLQETYASYMAYAPEASYQQRLMLCIVAIWIENPFFGYRRITEYVKDVLPGATVKDRPSKSCLDYRFYLFEVTWRHDVFGCHFGCLQQEDTDLEA
jgi:hypothetical protein